MEAIFTKLGWFWQIEDDSTHTRVWLRAINRRYTFTKPCGLNALDEYVLKMGLDIQNGLLSVENKNFKIASINDTGFRAPVTIKKIQNYMYR